MSYEQAQTFKEIRERIELTDEVLEDAVILVRLEKRRKEISSAVHKHYMKRCLCNKNRPWQCRDLQRSLRRKERAYSTVIRDIEDRLPRG